MANPKYAGLPGIAPPDEKDVYETDDLPEADQDPGDCMLELESECIDRPHLDVVSAHSKFKDKTLICGKGLDFSDRYRRRRHTGYEAASGDWEIAAEGENETILQRYNRLQCEVKALIEDIDKMKAEASEEKINEAEAVAALVPELERSLQQLNNCMNSSDSVGMNFIQSLSDPQGAQIKKLLTQLEGLKALDDTQKKTESKKEIANGMLSYELKTYPAQNKFMQSARVANLEQRLYKLESVVGSTPENLNRLQFSEFKNLCETAHEMSARINLLDSNQLEKIDSKLAALISKMDSIAEKRGGHDLMDKEKKINELYEFLGKSEAMSESLKTITERLVALKSLHLEATEFKKSLKELETDQANMASNIMSNEAALKKVEESLQEHLKLATKNIQAFESRLSALKK